MGGQPEKLLTLDETARRLELPADDVESLVLQGKLPSFRLAGNLLRFRLRDVEALRLEREEIRSRPPSLTERIRDFLHFNDFYLVALLIFLTLLALILAL